LFLWLGDGKICLAHITHLKRGSGDEMFSPSVPTVLAIILAGSQMRALSQGLIEQEKLFVRT